jgi:hypothetical protein
VHVLEKHAFVAVSVVCFLQTWFIMVWYGVGFWLWPWLLALTAGMAIGMAKWGWGLLAGLSCGKQRYGVVGFSFVPFLQYLDLAFLVFAFVLVHEQIHFYASIGSCDFYVEMIHNRLD